MRIRGLLFGSVFFLAVASAGAASACPCYPGDLQTYFNLNYTPVCTICHATLAGGAGTATQTFGAYLKANGVSGYEDSTLPDALKIDEAANHSSNDAGITDIEALMMDLNPNDPFPANGSSGPAQPAYGCGAHVAPTSDVVPAAGVAGLSLLFGFAVARRARRRRS